MGREVNRTDPARPRPVRLPRPVVERCHSLWPRASALQAMAGHGPLSGAIIAEPGGAHSQSKNPCLAASPRVREVGAACQ